MRVVRGRPAWMTSPSTIATTMVHGEMMMIWLMLSLVLCLAAVLGLLALVLQQTMRMQERWMRLFSDRLGTNPAIMESKSLLPTEPEPKQPDKRHRISVPIPGAALFRSNGGLK